MQQGLAGPWSHYIARPCPEWRDEPAIGGHQQPCTLDLPRLGCTVCGAFSLGLLGPGPTDCTLVCCSENEALWREVASLRQKHAQQQKVVNKVHNGPAGRLLSPPRLG